MQFTAKQLGELLKAEIDGDPNKTVQSIAKIEEADEDSISFIANEKYLSYVDSTKAGILLVSHDLPRGQNAKSTFLRVKDPYTSFSIILDKFSNNSLLKSGIEGNTYIGSNSSYQDNFYLGSFSYVSDDVQIGKNVKIFPNCFIGKGCVIGDNTVIYSGVNIYHDCKLGTDCRIHSGAVIGSDGFGFAPQKDGTYKKITQSGNVILGNYVEVGANTVIDRATLGSTKINDGVKIDNLVQVAHNVEVGKSTVIAAQAGISGSSKVGQYCMIGGQAGLVGHIRIADKTKINAQSGVTKSVKDGSSLITGSPAYDYKTAWRNEVLVRQLPDLVDKIEKLEDEIKNLKGNS